MKVYEVLVDKKAYNVKVLKRENNSFLVDVDGKTVEVKFANSGGGKFSIEINNEKVQTELFRLSGNITYVKVGNRTFEVQYPTPAFKQETMKMANEVVAPKDGVVKEILVSEGVVVNRGDVLAIIA